MIIIAFIFAIIGFLLFTRGKHLGFLIILVVLAFDFFGLLGMNGNSSNDALVVMVILILLTQLLAGQHPFSTKEDPIGRLIILLLLWFVIRYIISVLLKEETALYGLKVLKNDLFLLSYFVLRQIRVERYTTLFKTLIPVTIVIGIVGLVTSILHGFDGFVYERKTLIALTMPLLFSITTKDLKIPGRIIIITLFLLFIAMTLARGIFLATCASLVLYFYVIKKVSVGKFLLILPLAILFYFIYSNMEESKTDTTGGSDAFKELAEAREMESFDSFEGGSFLLRFAMTWERGDYLFDHPKALLFGVGTIHEDSPNNRFSFGIGSFKTMDEIRSRQMIDTDDVAFLAHWMRYGTVYLILFFVFLFVCYKTLWKLRQYKYMVPLLMLLTSMCISVITVDFFSRAYRFIIALMMLSMTYQYIIDAKARRAQGDK